MNFDADHFYAQLIELESGSLSPQAAEALRQLLLTSPDARKAYAEWMSLEAALVLESSDPSITFGSGQESSDYPAVSLPAHSVSETSEAKHHAPAPDRSYVDNSWFDWRSGIAIACTVLACVFGVRLIQLGNPGPTSSLAGAASALQHPAGERELTASGIALVTRVVQTDRDDVKLVAEGSALRPGPFELQSGIAQLEFFCGATLIVEGPARLDLLSEKSVQCISGKLQANVPPAARGFEVLVADSKVVDLGTEFGIEVSPSGVDLHVYDGEVVLQHPANASPQLLESGDSITWSGVENPSNSPLPQDGNRTKLVDVESFRRQAEGQSSLSYQQWLEFSQDLSQDTRLIAYYGMQTENHWERKLLDSRTPSDSELTGAIVGAEFSQGRWPEKTALEFKHPGDRVRVQIPGQFSSLSFCCWVRIDSLDRWYNSLFLTDNYQHGEPHWQILDSGQLFFSVRVSQTKGGQEHKEVLSPVFWKPSMSGQWLHLATTYDVENATTTHYLNGQPLSSEEIPAKQLVRDTSIGLASIGNWSAPTRDSEEFAIRNLNGRIDEIMIFADALTPEEIDEIYQHGKP